ncbi:hypothetical protein OG723_01115 [Streptomyces sp. NBC_01278]|uniref:hypothetical protein n=1 Tax=Streptomyces sp. NBC_01278 TaxID=2903809 RepID=UPI002E302E5B|nr:hypothetical protein [Streptomyces sp. NBC_01278]
MSAASLVGAGGRAHRLGLDGPVVELADDAEGEDRLSGRFTEEDADALAEVTSGGSGTTVNRLTAPGTAAPPAVPGDARVLDRFRSGAGGLRVTLTWPARLRGSAGGIRLGRAERSRTRSSKCGTPWADMPRLA